MQPEVGRSHPAGSTEWAANPRMDSFIYIVLALLAALAIIDLFVGVSNDAVNFVNSAVGCRTAPFWIIMAVTSRAAASPRPLQCTTPPRQPARGYVAFCAPRRRHAGEIQVNSVLNARQNRQGTFPVLILKNAEIFNFFQHLICFLVICSP